jgi:hypothetical protein
MNWLNNLGFGMLSGQSPLQQAEARGFGGGQPQQQPQAKPNRFLNDPAMSQALLRMGGTILQANAQGAGFGGSLGAGVNAFATGLNESQEAQLRQAQIQSELAKAKREQQFGIRSDGFEGDIARAMVVLNSPDSTPEDRRVAQSIIQTAEREQGAYDPTDGTWKFNQRQLLPLELQRPATADMMRTPAVQEEPLGALVPPAMAGTTDNTPSTPASQLLPKPDFMGGQQGAPTGNGPRVSFTPSAPPETVADSELAQYGYIPTNNRKTDAESRARAVQARIAARAKGDETVATSANLASSARGILTKLDEAENALQSFPTGFAGNFRGGVAQARAMLGNSEADMQAQSYETLDRLSKELGAEGLKQFGGSDTQMELKVAIETALDPSARPESNKRVIDQKRAALQIIAQKPVIEEQYIQQNGSLDGFQRVWADYQKQQWDAYRANNPIEGNKSKRLKFNPATGDFE